ncbi:MAG TPA: hypothetical protein IAA15_09635 [Candidatus Olsenella pullicola]|nr:hypothetical protein [Candidatus Olsenella pullicola]
MRFRNAQLDLRQIKESHIMENVVYNELRARGYSVDVGVVEKRVREEAGTFASSLRSTSSPTEAPTASTSSRRWR